MKTSALADARTLVRGALDNRFGLRMGISEPDGIEWVGASAEGEPQKP
jgi:hypothetical protein